MSKQLRQGGFSVVELVIILVVLGFIGGVGYYAWQSRQDKAKTTTASSASSAAADKLTWKKAAAAVSGKYADADVVQTGDNSWRLYYAIQPEVPGNKLEVYSSTSSDGKTWTQESGTRKTMATFPEVVKLPDGRYRMYFQNAGVIKSAISSDGLSFSDESGTRIDLTNDAGLTLENVAAPAVLLLDDGSYMMVYRGTVNERYATNTPNPTTQLLFWAISSDGLTFTKKGLAVDSRNTTLNGQLDGPDLVKWDDGKLHLHATTYTGVYKFVFDGKKFDSGKLVFAGEATQDAQGFHGAPPGDPSLAKINGTWFMYYGSGPETPGLDYAALDRFY